jgi:hypothetical protein
MRSIDQVAIQDFQYKLSFETWDSVCNTSDINKVYNSFLNSFLRIFYSSFPLKELTFNSNSNTWITPGIKISCKHKRDLYLLYGAHGSVVVKALCYKPGGRGLDSR